MNVTQGLRRVLQTNPEGIATVDGERRRTWREIGERVDVLDLVLLRSQFIILQTHGFSSVGHRSDNERANAQVNVTRNLSFTRQAVALAAQ